MGADWRLVRRFPSLRERPRPVHVPRPTRALSTVCTCKHPEPIVVRLFGTVTLVGSYECEHCGRPCSGAVE